MCATGKRVTSPLGQAPPRDGLEEEACLFQGPADCAPGGQSA